MVLRAGYHAVILVLDDRFLPPRQHAARLEFENQILPADGVRNLTWSADADRDAPSSFRRTVMLCEPSSYHKGDSSSTVGRASQSLSRGTSALKKGCTDRNPALQDDRRSHSAVYREDVREIPVNRGRDIPKACASSCAATQNSETAGNIHACPPSLLPASNACRGAKRTQAVSEAVVDHDEQNDVGRIIRVPDLPLPTVDDVEWS